MRCVIIFAKKIFQGLFSYYICSDIFALYLFVYNANAIYTHYMSIFLKQEIYMLREICRKINNIGGKLHIKEKANENLM